VVNVSGITTTFLIANKDLEEISMYSKQSFNGRVRIKTLILSFAFFRIYMQYVPESDKGRLLSKQNVQHLPHDFKLSKPSSNGFFMINLSQGQTVDSV
jgi:hypothetical protein